MTHIQTVSDPTRTSGRVGVCVMALSHIIISRYVTGVHIIFHMINRSLMFFQMCVVFHSTLTVRQNRQVIMQL